MNTSTFVLLSPEDPPGQIDCPVLLLGELTFKVLCADKKVKLHYFGLNAGR